MIGYVMVGTNDLARAQAFYTPLLEPLGMSVNKTYSGERYTWYAPSSRGTMFVITKPYDEKPAAAGNGAMVSLAAPSKEVVDSVYAKAIAAGAKDEGKPGLRGDTFYGAYFRDLDGNKLCVFKMG